MFCPEILNYHRGLVPSRWYKVSNIRHKHHWGYPHTSVRRYSRWHLPLKKTCIFWGEDGFQGSSRLFQLSTPSWTRPTPPSPYNPSATLSVASPGRVKKNRPCNMDVKYILELQVQGDLPLIFVNVSKMNRSAKVHAACTVTHQNKPCPCSRKKILPSTTTTIIHILGLWSHFNDQYWIYNYHYRCWLYMITVYFVVLFVTILIEMLVMIPIASLQFVLNCSPYESLDPPIEGFEPL